jgi:hypothetical protein
MNVKRGPELKEGDVIRFWVNSEVGMRVKKIMPYTGKFPEICCSFAVLKAEEGYKAGTVIETAIEHNAMYEIIEEAGHVSK